MDDLCFHYRNITNSLFDIIESWRREIEIAFRTIMEVLLVTQDTRQLYALYLTRFASSFGLITLLTLLPTYIDLFDPSGIVIGLFTTVTLAQAIAIIPLAWAGDRYDKRSLLLGNLGIGILAYGAFAAVSTSTGFILTRGLQGIAATGMGPITARIRGTLSTS
jgi:MFS family permease